MLWAYSLALRTECSTYTNIDTQTKGKGNFEACFAVTYGVGDALAPFPLHQLVNTMTATINISSVSRNIPDCLPALLRRCDPDELAEYDAATPTALD